MGDQRRLGSQALCGRGGLAAGVSAAYDNDIEVAVHAFKPSRAELLANCRAIVYFAASNIPDPEIVRANQVSRETWRRIRVCTSWLLAPRRTVRCVSLRMTSSRRRRPVYFPMQKS